MFSWIKQQKCIPNKTFKVAILDLGFEAVLILLYRKYLQAKTYTICQRVVSKLNQIRDTFRVFMIAQKQQLWKFIQILLVLSLFLKIEESPLNILAYVIVYLQRRQLFFGQIYSNELL